MVRRYTFTNITNGFIIDGGPKRNTVRLIFEGDTWNLTHLTLKDRPAIRIAVTNFSTNQIKTIFQEVLGDFEGNCRWLLNKIGWNKKIIKRFQYQKCRQRMMSYGVEQALNGACVRTLGYSPLIDNIFQRPEIFENKFLVADMIKYRAAIFAVVDAVKNDMSGGCKLADMVKTGDWRKYYYDQNTVENHRNKAKNKVLDNLPPGVHPDRDLKMCIVPFERPIYNRSHLIMYGLAYPYITEYQHDYRIEVKMRLFRLIGKSTTEQVKAVLRKAKQSEQFPWLDCRKPSTLETVVDWLIDYDEPYYGSLMGWYLRCKTWHEMAAKRAARKRLERMALADKLTLEKPPIPLPEIVGIRFLETEQDLLAEAISMKSCIDTYAMKAKDGGCYLFHVEYQGEQASMEIDDYGLIRQSYGPCNQCNKASDWGRIVMRNWCGHLTKHRKKDIIPVEPRLA